MGHKVPVAKITRAHGIKGEVKILPYLLQNQDLIPSLPRFFLRQGKEGFSCLYPTSVREAPGGGFLLKFKEISTREQAEELKGKELFLDLDDLPAREEGEYYVFELVGLKVKRLPEGEIIGEVRGLMPVGPYDLLEIRLWNGKTVYLPMIEEMIQKIDLEKGEILVQPEEGLIEAQV